jgi:Uma2 family endonuclease
MVTVLKFGPTDHGRPLSLDEFKTGEYQEGYRYELIDGKLYVSPAPNQPENFIAEWLSDKLKAFAKKQPQAINYVTTRARVFVPDREDVTTPEPDAAAYKNYPLHLPIREIQWEDVSPILVVEVLSSEDPDKDLERNVELYFLVPSIKEYWVLDTRVDPEQPTMRVHRRHGRRWRILDLAAGDTYTTKLLPGFEVVLDPRT